MNYNYNQKKMVGGETVQCYHHENNKLNIKTVASRKGRPGPCASRTAEDGEKVADDDDEDEEEDLDDDDDEEEDDDDDEEAAGDGAGRVRLAMSWAAPGTRAMKSACA